MNYLIRSQIAKKSFAVVMTAVVVFSSIPLTIFAAPTVDITANGQNSLTLATSTDSFVIALSTVDATVCDITSPMVSGIAPNTSFTIAPGSPDYPAIGGSVTFTVSCSDAVGDSATDSVVVSLPAVVIPPVTPAPTIDVKVNGSDGPVTLNSSDTYTYTWASTNALVCDQTSPVTSGISANGTSSVFDSSDTTFFPSTTTPVTITISCSNTTGTSSDSVVINLATGATTTPTTPTTPSGGGGGGGGGRRRTTPVATPVPLTCPLITEYMRADLPNNPIEVMKLQAFLKVFEGYDFVTINGVFDQATENAVNAFQLKYEADVLTPWSEPGPTGYVYILTLKKVNEIYCQTVYNLTQAQIDEINAYRALRQSGGEGVDLPIVGVVDEIPPEGGEPTQIGDKGQIQQFASALFAFPETVKDKLQCLYELVVILIVLYILGVIIRDVLYKDTEENVLKRFLARWGVHIAGLLIAIITAYIIGEFCLLLPLLILAILSTLWVILYPNHNSIRASVKSWFLVIKARLKR